MVLNLDVGNIDDAEKLVDTVGEYFGYAKVGSELYAESGAEAVLRLRERGMKIFLDLKLHDIPNTVERACKVHAARGISMMTVHAGGGVEMMRAARRGLDEGAELGGFDPPILLGVSVLTSLPADDSAFNERLSWISEVGCDLVCSAHELNKLAQYPHVRALVPGIRLAGQDANDQTRVATPESAMKDGATWIALGRAVYAADDPLAAAAEVSKQVATCL
jgi:orotidine-5'-phosphate decarboxylase